MKIKKSQSPTSSNKNDKTIYPGNFASAMITIINGKKIRRLEWTDQEEYGLLKDNFLMIHRDNKFHQWIVSDGDLSAIDWVILK